jgi:hypothetical protein
LHETDVRATDLDHRSRVWCGRNPAALRTYYGIAEGTPFGDTG